LASDDGRNLTDQIFIARKKHKTSLRSHRVHQNFVIAEQKRRYKLRINFRAIARVTGGM